MSSSKVIDTIMVLGTVALFSFLAARAAVFESPVVTAENIAGTQGGTPAPAIVIQSYPADAIIIESVLSQ